VRGGRNLPIGGRQIAFLWDNAGMRASGNDKPATILTAWPSPEATTGELVPLASLL